MALFCEALDRVRLLFRGYATVGEVMLMLVDVGRMCKGSHNARLSPISRICLPHDEHEDAKNA